MVAVTMASHSAWSSLDMTWAAMAAIMMFHDDDITFPANDDIVRWLGVSVFLMPKEVQHRETSVHFWGVQAGKSAETNVAHSDSMSVLSGTIGCCVWCTAWHGLDQFPLCCYAWSHTPSRSYMLLRECSHLGKWGWQAAPFYFGRTTHDTILLMQDYLLSGLTVMACRGVVNLLFKLCGGHWLLICCLNVTMGALVLIVDCCVSDSRR